MLGIAALAAWGAYALGFVVFGDSFDLALTAACVGSVVVAVGGLGSLTRLVGLVLLGIPVTVAALATTVYVAGMKHVDEQPRYSVVVASQRCTHTYTHHDSHGVHRGCDDHEYTFTDAAGKPIGDRLFRKDRRTGYAVGEKLDVYQQASGTVRVYPKSFADPLPQVRTAARYAVPIFVVYVVIAAVAGMVHRRVRRAVLPDQPLR